MHRRDVLKLTALTPLLPSLLRAAPPPSPRVVIFVELGGGNDGLNTLVPRRDPAYRRLRPRLALPADALLALDDAVGFAPALAPLMPLWEAGQLAVAQGVGAPEPNRSHFASIARWDTGQLRPRDTVGWVTTARGDEGAGSVVLGGEAGPLAGPRTLVVERPERFLRAADALRPVPTPAGPAALDHLVRTRRATRAGAATVRAALARAPALDAFGDDPLGRQLRTAARLILGGAPVHAIKVRHDGFDTHAGQPGRHPRLLEQLAVGLAALRAALAPADAWRRTLVVTYAEFGRRPTENGSRGTDHGTAAPHLLLGGAVRGGLYGAQPRLDDLEDGDLKHTLDFRRLWATAAAHWNLRRTAGEMAPLWS